MERHTLSDRHDDKMKQKSSGVVNIEQKCIQEFDVQSNQIQYMSMNIKYVNELTDGIYCLSEFLETT